MSILFLDHDSVICLSANQDSRLRNTEGLDSIFDSFDSEAIRVLNEIIDMRDCEIVVSSDWRHNHSLSVMRELYQIRGIKKLPIGYTGHVPGNAMELEICRAKEIVHWMNTHDPEKRMKWCAIDDLDMTPWLADKNFVLVPSSKEGIAQLGIKQKILNRL